MTTGDAPARSTLWSRRQVLAAAAAPLACTDAAAALPVAAPAASQAAPPAEWGTYLRPFSAQSPWNARPVKPVFDDFEIPRSSYYPALVEGGYSTGVFLAATTDPPMEVRGLPGRKGVWDPDAEAHRSSIVIPHWPAGTLPATGSDGHADIVDAQSGIVHSFFQLRSIDGQWCATQYSWTRIDGRGWGEPGHYFQGPRAAGVPSMAGIMRKHEVNDGDDMYRHALALSLTYNALSADPPYVFPATSADRDAKGANKGRIPQGALLMLPPSFDVESIRSPKLRKVANTLQRYGGYVVDRNVGTPFTAYVEFGSNLKPHGDKWNGEVARDLDRMRAGLRWVVATDGWLDAHGKPMELERRLNLLSMRGPWHVERGSPGTYDTWRQAVVFAPGSDDSLQINRTGRSLNAVAWAAPVPGQRYRLEAKTTGGGRLRLRLSNKQRDAVYDSGELADGESATFEWPADQRHVSVFACSGKSPQGSSVSGSLVALRRSLEGPNAKPHAAAHAHAQRADG